MQLSHINPAQTDYQRIAALLRQRPTKRRGLTMPEFAETTIVTAGKDKGMRFKLEKSPYLRRPMECLSPESPIQLVIGMLPSQVGKSVLAQIAVAYYSKELPSEIIYAVPDLASARKVMQRRLEPLYNSVNIEFRTQTESKNSRRTGDVTFSKEFDGGNLDIVTANSSAALAAETKRVGIGDEISKWKTELADEGSPWAQLWARLKNWMDEKKALAISTPTDEDTCKVFDLFLTGTQEQWFVQCPFCGEFQVMKSVKSDTGAGLDYRIKNGNIIRSSIVYVCKKCTKGIKETKKFEIQQTGEWRAQAIPRDDYTVSFHLHVLNSQFETWFEVAKKYELSLDSHAERKEYMNHYAGLPWREVGARPKLENVLRLKGTYKSGSVPMGALFLTIGADVQRGAKRYESMSDEKLAKEIAKAGTEVEEKNFPRVEFEVLGIGPGHRTFSILYKRFLGRVDNAYSGAWELFNDWALELVETYGFFGFIREVDGMEFPIALTFIDSGDGTNTEVVYQFTERWDGCYPCKGANVLKQRKGQKGDEVTMSNFMRYKVGKSGDTLIYNISTNFYKGQVYSALNVGRIDEDIQKNGYCDFPRDRSADYFRMLTAEERRVDGSYHAGGRRNEALDCFDGTTEILTNMGWKRFYNLDKSELVATVNLENDLIEYQKPIEYIERYHTGEMVHIKGVRLDILVTPEHRMVASKKKQEVISRKPYKRKWNLDTHFEFVLAKDLTIHHQLKNTSNWKSSATDKIIEPYVSTQNKLISKRKVIDAYDWAAFLGFFVSEGSRAENYSTTQGGFRYRTTLHQMEGENSDKLRKLLNRLPFKFKEYKDRTINFVCAEKQLYLALEDCGKNVYHKKAPQWVKDQDSSVIKVFLEWAIMGDGHVDKQGHRSYYTVSEQLANDVQELFIKSGSSARIDYHEAKPYKAINGREPKNGGKNTKPQFHVRETRFKKKSLDGGGNGKRECLSKKISFKGNVYCVSVPNETLILRRNGIAFIAGNCRVYSECAGDVYVEMLMNRYRELATTANGVTAAGVQYRGMSKEMARVKINRKTVIDDLSIKMKLAEGYYR